MSNSVLLDLYHKLKEKSDNDFQRIDISHKQINDCDWFNHIFISPSIRYGHLEYFKGSNDKVEVVHCVFYPSYFKALPIFGFDVISLGGKVTGIFCDYTPAPYHDMILQATISSVKASLIHLQRDLPGWTEFFSPEFIAIAPQDEYIKAEEACVALFDLYIGLAKAFDYNDQYLNAGETKDHIEGQNKYSIGQRKNSKTQKALAKYIGEDASKEFIEKTLFPTYCH
jgi:phycocyanobilin:ferredoxin oxidoreductase